MVVYFQVLEVHTPILLLTKNKNTLKYDNEGSKMAQNGSKSPPFPPKMSKIILMRVNSLGVSVPVILLQLNDRLIVPPYVLAALGGVTLNNFCKHPPFQGKMGKKGVNHENV